MAHHQQHAMALQQQYHVPGYGTVEMPMGMPIPMGMMMGMPGYGQLQYGHNNGTGLISYMPQQMMMSRGMSMGVPQMMTTHNPYGMNGSPPVIYSSQLSADQLQMQSGYQNRTGIASSGMRNQTSHLGGEDSGVWDNHIDGINDKVHYYNQHNDNPVRYPITEYRNFYGERPPHHNGGHVGSSTSGVVPLPRRIARPPPNSSFNNDPEFSLDLDKVASGADVRTTIMIRNIPNKYTQWMLLAEINMHHEGLYDFYYLPIDFKNRCNVGYAFINFMDPKHIIPFFHDFDSQKWKNFNSEKVCTLTYARIQGKASMVARFQNSSLLEKDSEYRPLLFYSSGPEKGKPEPFSASTRINSQMSRISPQRRRNNWDESTVDISNGHGETVTSNNELLVDANDIPLKNLTISNSNITNDVEKGQEKSA
jgi:hypothetical protein